MKRVVTTAIFCIAAASFSLWAGPKKIVVPKDVPSVQKALDEAAEGDTVYVQNGVYRGSIVMKDNVVLIGQDVEKTVLRGSGSKPVVEGANRAVIKNFTIESGGTGIICKNTNPLIEHNIVRSNRTGIHCLISLPEIKNNLIYYNKWTGIYCELITNAQRTSIDHNFIGENGYCGIMLANKSEVLIQNTILFKNKQFGIYVNEDSKRSRIVYNDIFNNRAPYNLYAVVNETNISKDPGLPATGIETYTYGSFGGNNYPLAGMGKAGSDIGPMPEAALNKVRIDSDNDGVPDDVDQCPDMPEDKDGFQDEDGCPDFDNDNDGIYDSQDKCPNDPEDFDGFEDSDGCPDIDNDKDGIPDKLDKCPNMAEDIDGYQDEDGCPDGGGPGKAPAGVSPQSPKAPAKPADVKKPAAPALKAPAAPATPAEPKKKETAPVKK
jgi:OOP family OmpA-OmpF porin